MFDTRDSLLDIRYWIFEIRNSKFENQIIDIRDIRDIRDVCYIRYTGYIRDIRPLYGDRKKSSRMAF
jgi:hypothetical protein